MLRMSSKRRRDGWDGSDAGAASAPSRDGADDAADAAVDFADAPLSRSAFRELCKKKKRKKFIFFSIS